MREEKRIYLRLLITTSRLDSYGGSEIVVLELVEWFISRGWQVTLLSEAVGELMLHELSRFLNGRQLTLSNSGAETPAVEDFDLVWITHNVWPDSFVRKTKEQSSRTSVVTLHMGSLEIKETTVLPELENSLADRILVVSGRTQNRMIEFGLDKKKMELFDNPAPSTFFGRIQKESVGLKSVLLVSNHLPTELIEASRQLGSQGTHVSHLGVSGDRFERLSRELLIKFDAVVTIGKTTQYCLVMGLPVYSYDHFGGAGWLSDGNFTFEAFNNFSGYRTQRKLSADQIASEIRDGFQEARLWSKENKVKFSEHYSLERQMGVLLNSLKL